MRKSGIGLIFMVMLFVISPAIYAADLDLVTDYAYLLSDEEFYELNERAWDISEKYKCEIAIVTIDDMGDDDAYEFAKHIINEYNYGYGLDKSCLLFFISMAERDYALVAYGYGNTAFTDHGKDVLLDKHVLPLLAENNYYKAFSAYFDIADEYLSLAKAGTPFDKDTDPEYSILSLPVKLSITFIFPLLVVGWMCYTWAGKMKTAEKARVANQYIPEDGFELTNQSDLFLFRTETRRKIEKKSSGGTTTDRDGASGRKGKF